MYTIVVIKRWLITFFFVFIVNVICAQLTANAGTNQTICAGDSVIIGGVFAANGGTPPYTYTWIPAAKLSDTTSSNPIAFPTTTTTFTLSVTDAASATKTSTVKITVKNKPSISAGKDITIEEGTVAVLHGSGSNNYQWWSTVPLKYSTTANPESEPKDTTTYYLKTVDQAGICSTIDSVVVYVIPNNKVVFYNTFTPNGDNNNDQWYIGNIEKYPNNHLEIYNRYGKQVYSTDSYLNTWDGRNLGEALPAATYFYILDLGDGSEAYHGTVTIVN